MCSRRGQVRSAGVPHQRAVAYEGCTQRRLLDSSLRCFERPSQVAGVLPLPAAHAARSAALKLVASLAAEASSGRLRGAALLDLLHARCAGAMGDAAAHKLALRLLRAAAEPYFAMLERWL